MNQFRVENLVYTEVVKAFNFGYYYICHHEDSSFFENNNNKMTTQINHPDYYNKGDIKVSDFIEAYDLNFNLGNVI